MNTKNKIISQRSNYNNDFGEVLRSSAIFYYQYGPGFKTTISVLDYWTLKREIKIALIATTRTMNGYLLRRERLHFSTGMVINYCPAFEKQDTFCGSLEIEIFATENMHIPYAAVMAVYENSESVSMVHSYGRVYSAHEIEEGRTITSGRESCFSVVENDLTRTFFVFHNGSRAKEAQTATVLLKRPNNESHQILIPLPVLAPYETTKIYLGDHCEDITRFLNGETGDATVSFELNDSFARTLIGWEHRDKSQLQVTHSDFDYSIHQTDLLNNQEDGAFMYIPDLPCSELGVRIYGDIPNGTYTLQRTAGDLHFQSGQNLFVDARNERFRFNRQNAAFPTRLHTKLVGRNSERLLPFQCCLGVFHNLRPRKRLWWGLCSYAQQTKTSLVFLLLRDIYGEAKSEGEIVIRIYSEKTKAPLEHVVLAQQIPEFSKGIELEKLFPGIRGFLGESFGYYTVFFEEGSLQVFSMLSLPNGSVTIEHGF